MKTVLDLLVLAVAGLHGYFLVLEMLLWEKPLGRRSFGTTAEFARASRVLAANQGLYNGFLCAGLIWSLLLGPSGVALRDFLLVCIVVAGVYGAWTVHRKILFLQALPAALAFSLAHLAQ